MIKRAVLSILVLASSVSFAFSPQDLPMPNQYSNVFVSDTANIIGEVEEKRLDDVLNSHYEKTGNQIAVVTTVDTSSNSSPKSFAVDLFNEWQLGDADKDNGLLILLSIGDRRIEFETGYGLEGVLPDVTQKRIQREHMVPSFKEGDYEAGLLKGTYAVIDKINIGQEAERVASASYATGAIQAKQEVAPKKPSSSPSYVFYGILISVVLFLSLFMILFYFRIYKDDTIGSNTPAPKKDIDPTLALFCQYCNKITRHTSLPLDKIDRRLHTSLYEARLSRLKIFSLYYSKCQSCTTLNKHYEYKVELLTCKTEKCDSRTRYVIFNAKMTFQSYLYTHVDNVMRTAPLQSNVFKKIPKSWQSRSHVKTKVTSCFDCNKPEFQIIDTFVPKSPKPRPKTSSTSSSADYLGYTAASQSSYGSSKSKSSSSGSGSSFGSGSGWGGGGSDFGGGSSGGGGAGSDF